MLDSRIDSAVLVALHHQRGNTRIDAQPDSEPPAALASRHLEPRCSVCVSLPRSCPTSRCHLSDRGLTRLPCCPSATERPSFLRHDSAHRLALSHRSRCSYLPLISPISIRGSCTARSSCPRLTDITHGRGVGWPFATLSPHVHGALRIDDRLDLGGARISRRVALSHRCSIANFHPITRTSRKHAILRAPASLTRRTSRRNPGGAYPPKSEPDRIRALTTAAPRDRARSGSVQQSHGGGGLGAYDDGTAGASSAIGEEARESLRATQ